MNSVCPNPSCGAVYALASHHVGRRMTCKKCGSSLQVGEHGLQLAGPEPPMAVREIPDATAASDPQAIPLPAGPGAAAQLRERMAGIADLSTWLFGAGLFFTIL